ncbi:MAG: response regulator [Nitrospinota bacterium]|nr:MAG: response regulator [Nitrospinota bacterium]
MVVRISDTGTGIDADTLGKIFDPFFTTKGGSNSGLGLSTVYGIIKQHQGEISVESKEGKGTTFWLRFPIDKSVSSPPPSATATNPSTTARILVVDDEAMICDIVEEALSSYGHRVRKAYSGYEGINCFQEEPFDLVLTDLSMSEINGYAVTRRIKALNPAVPVVLMTGWGESIDQTEARAQGIDYILSKPFNVSDLVLLVETMLVKPHQN